MCIRPRNDRYCVEWVIELYSLTHSGVRNDEFRTPSTNQPHLLAVIQSRRLSLLGHIARIPDEADAEKILTGTSSYNMVDEYYSAGTEIQ